MTDRTKTVSPIPLMELTSGVYAFKALALADHLGLFTQISGGGTTVQEFAERHGINARPAELLLTACASIGLLESVDGRYRNTPVAEEYLVEGRPYYFGDWVKTVDRREYEAYTRIESSLRGNHPVTWDPEKQESLFDPNDQVMVDMFWGGMYSMSCYAGALLAEAFDFGSVKNLLDVGGGGAAYDIEICRAYPHLKATVFDLPFVCDLTKKRVSAVGLEDRIDFVAGSFFTDELPRGYDVILLSNILHDWGEDDARKIIACCAQALEPGGQLLISESFVNEDRTGPALAALMSLNMLIETWGRNYTVGEYSAWLREAGLDVVDALPLAGTATNGALRARKP